VTEAAGKDDGRRPERSSARRGAARVDEPQCEWCRRGVGQDPPIGDDPDHAEQNRLDQRQLSADERCRQPARVPVVVDGFAPEGVDEDVDVREDHRGPSASSASQTATRSAGSTRKRADGSPYAGSCGGG